MSDVSSTAPGLSGPLPGRDRERDRSNCPKGRHGPESEIEMARVYAELGESINARVEWIRAAGGAAETSHPYRGPHFTRHWRRGPVWDVMGYSGLLLTPGFGARQRIGVIYMSLD